MKVRSSNLASDVGKNETKVDLPAAKLDATLLRVFDLSAGKASEGGSRAEVVRYSASGQTDYAEWTICPDTDSSSCDGEDCEQSKCAKNITPYNLLIIPKLFAGEVTIGVRACVEPDKALQADKNCGEWEYINYDSKVVDRQVRELFEQRQRILEELEKLQGADNVLFDNYYEDNRVCLKNQADFQQQLKQRLQVARALDASFDKFMQFAGRVDNSLGNLGAKAYDGLKSVADKASDALKKITKKICRKDSVDQDCLANLGIQGSTMSDADKQEYCRSDESQGGVVGFICDFSQIFSEQMSTMFKGMVDIRYPINVVSKAVTTLQNPNDAVSRQCIGEQKLIKGLEGVLQDVDKQQQLLRGVEADLKQRGEL